MGVSVRIKSHREEGTYKKFVLQYEFLIHVRNFIKRDFHKDKIKLHFRRHILGGNSLFSVTHVHSIVLQQFYSIWLAEKRIKYVYYDDDFV